MKKAISLSIALLLVLGVFQTTSFASKEETETVLPELSEEEMFRRELRREFHVRIPSSFDFTIDPYEIDGKGPVYSAPIVIGNSGLEPVKITISDLCADTQHTVDPTKFIIRKKTDMTIGSSSENDSLTIGSSDEEENPIEEAVTIGFSEDLTIGSSITPRSLGFGSQVDFQAEPVSPDTTGKVIQLVLHRIDKETPDIYLTKKAAEPIVIILKENEDAVFEITGTVSLSPENPWESGEVVISSAIRIDKITVEEADRLLEQQKRGEELAEEEEQEQNKIIRYIANPETPEEEEKDSTTKEEQDPQQAPDDPPIEKTNENDLNPNISIERPGNEQQ